MAPGQTQFHPHQRVAGRGAGAAVDQRQAHKRFTVEGHLMVRCALVGKPLGIVGGRGWGDSERGAGVAAMATNEAMLLE